MSERMGLSCWLGFWRWMLTLQITGPDRGLRRSRTDFPVFSLGVEWDR